jgi:hypothetical protein
MLLDTLAKVVSFIVENDSINTKKHINKITRSAKVTIHGGAEREFFSTLMVRSGGIRRRWSDVGAQEGVDGIGDHEWAFAPRYRSQAKRRCLAVNHLVAVQRT